VISVEVVTIKTREEVIERRRHNMVHMTNHWTNAHVI
jgi:hypothetical protein